MPVNPYQTQGQAAKHHPGNVVRVGPFGSFEKEESPKRQNLIESTGIPLNPNQETVQFYGFLGHSSQFSAGIPFVQ